MKTRRTYFILAALLFVAGLAACSHDDALSGSDEGTADEITFTAAIGGTALPDAQTRVTPDGDKWVMNDEIGIYVSPGPGVVYPSVENKKYTVRDAVTGALVPADDTHVHYPVQGTVDILAYYPYGRPNEFLQIIVNLTDQSKPAAIDLMVARAAGVGNSPSPVKLKFEHLLSKITLNVSAGNGLTPDDIKGLTGNDVFTGRIFATVSWGLQGNPPQLSSAESINLYKSETIPEGVHATFSAIILPKTTSSIPITFQIGGREYKCTLTSDDEFQAGNNYVFPVTVNDRRIDLGPLAITAWDEQGSASATLPPDRP